MSALQHDFNYNELSRWFLYNYDCWYCLLTEPDQTKRNRPDAFHHTMGRKGKHSNSILNAAPVNNTFCHLPHHGMLRRPASQVKLLRLTITYLLSQAYQLNETDQAFIEDNYKSYKAILEGVQEQKIFCTKCQNEIIGHKIQRDDTVCFNCKAEYKRAIARKAIKRKK